MFRLSFVLAVLSIISFTSCNSTKLDRLLTGMSRTEDIYMDQRPISILEYKEFVYNQAEDKKKKYLPKDAESLAQYNSAENNGSPVKGIDFVQAKSYCEWRSIIWNETGLNYKFDFHIPNKSEWELTNAKPDYSDLKAEWIQINDKYVKMPYEDADKDILLKDTGFRCSLIAIEKSEI